MNLFYKLLNFILNKVLIIFFILFIVAFIGSVCFSNKKINEKRYKYKDNNNIYTYMIFASRGKEAEQHTKGPLNDVLQTANSSFTDKLYYKCHSKNISNNMKKKINNVLYTSTNKQKLYKLYKEKSYSNKLTNIKLKKLKEKIFNKFNIYFYIVLLLFLIILSLIYIEFQWYQILQLFNEYINNFMVNHETLLSHFEFNHNILNFAKYFKKYEKHILRCYCTKTIINSYVFCIIPIIISVFSGILTYVNNIGYYYFTMCSVPILSFIQALRMYYKCWYKVKIIHNEYSTLRISILKYIKQNII